MTRHRWGRAEAMPGSLKAVQACDACSLCRTIRLRLPRRYDAVGDLDTRGAWTVAVVGPCPRRTAA